MPNQITMTDVARAAGVHQTTVSLALRNHPRISEETKSRVMAAARKLGYRPNPLVSALVAGRCRRGREKIATLGYVVGDAPEEGGQASVHTYAELYNGVRSRAEELGYGLDILWLGDPKLSQKRFKDIAKTRAIHGLVIAPLKSYHVTLDIAWQHFACVAYGYSMAQPRLHRVCPDFYHSMLDLLERCRSKGIRRVGLVMDTVVDKKADHFWLAAFLADQRLQKSKSRSAIPPLLLSRNSMNGAEAWLAKHQPEAVIGLTSTLLNLRKVVDGGQTHTPGHWFALDSELSDQPNAFPGVRLDRHAAGEVCVDLLTSMLYRNERGIPRTPQSVLVETGWNAPVSDP